MAVDLTKPVLVVDDYNTMIRIMHNLLKQLGFEQVDGANNGATALAKLRRRDYGLVISDWNMEPMTGFALLQEMRSDPSLAEIPFIMVTAESKTENLIAAKKAGIYPHRQAVQRADAQKQDRRRVRRSRSPRSRGLRATTSIPASLPSACRRRP